MGAVVGRAVGGIEQQSGRSSGKRRAAVGGAVERAVGGLCGACVCRMRKVCPVMSKILDPNKSVCSYPPTLEPAEGYLGV
jgi:uncharacterized protein YcfJ